MPGMGDLTPEQRKMFEEMRRRENAGLTPDQIEARDREREMTRKKNRTLLQETEEICQRGSYEKEGTKVELGITSRQMSAARVLLPEEVKALQIPACEESVPCAFSCEDTGAFSLAREKVKDPSYADGLGTQCALRIRRNGTGGIRSPALRRIEGIFRCAESLAYRNLILGAFGCGAFRNDPALVSDDFYQILTGPLGRGLKHADFAVLSTNGKDRNYQEFCRNFG